MLAFEEEVQDKEVTFIREQWRLHTNHLSGVLELELHDQGQESRTRSNLVG